MRITHVAIWTNNLEGMRNFYMHYFDATSSEGYYNHTKDFRSYFLTFDSDCSIKLMNMPQVLPSRNHAKKYYTGISHLAINVGSRQRVDELTEILRTDGFRIAGEPRMTGHGFYESVILDPEGNRIELVAN